MRHHRKFLWIALVFSLTASASFAADTNPQDKNHKPKRGLIENVFLFPLEVGQNTQRLLQENIFGLGEVRVSGSRVPSRFSNASATDLPHNITLVGAKDIAENGSSSLPEILIQKEGVTLSDETGLGLNARVDLRGFGGEAKQALVIFDGMRAVEPFDNSTVWHLYPEEFLEQVEIRRGGGSTVYGEGAFSGVVQLNSKGPTPKLRMSTNNGWGSFGTERYFTDVSGTQDGWGFYAGGHYLSTNGYREVSGHEGDSGLFKLEKSVFERLKISNAFYAADHRTDIPGPLLQAEVEADRRQRDPDGQPGNRFSDQLYQNALQVAYSNEESGVDIVDLIGFRRRNQDSFQSFAGAFPGSFQSDIETHTLSNVLQGSWSLDGPVLDSNIVAGTEWSTDDIHNPTNFIPAVGSPSPLDASVHREMTGFFAQHRLTLWERLILEYGGRLDYIEYEIDRQARPESARSMDNWGPQVGIEFKPLDALSLYGSYAEAFRGPDVNTLILEAPGLFAPNPDIDPQIARHHEAGVRYAHPVWGSARADIFYIETKKEILFNESVFQSENFDTRRGGYEIAGEIALAPGVEIFGNYTYTRPEFDHGVFDGKTIPLTPRSRWAAGCALEPLRHLKFSAQAVGVYDQFALNDFNNVARADDYWTLGGKIAYAPKVWEIYLKVQNILNEKYSSFVSFSNFGNTTNFNPAPTAYGEAGFKIEI